MVRAPVTQEEASRFLLQATMGATRADIDKVIALGFEGWIDEQMAMPREISHWDWLVSVRIEGDRSYISGTGYGWDQTIWRQLIGGQDQLRQRIGIALLDFLVVGMDGVTGSWPTMQVAAYMDVLMDNAFGNYRTLIGQITTSTAMGSFLTYLDNRKGDPVSGAEPDENYARELMQLFTLGLHQLNMDGTPQLAGGEPIETYGSDDVAQLARVMTGLTYANADKDTPDRLRLPMIVNESIHEGGASTVLGATVSGPGATAIPAALDIIFRHPNVAPFLALNLIKRLTSSNPSPAYVASVARTFVDNGRGERGDLAATVRAILLHAEVRSPAALANPSAGRLRDPVQRFTGWARSFNAVTAGKWKVGDLSAITKLGQSPGRSPSVFGFFRPGYSAPGTQVSGAGLVAPEFQLVNEQTVLSFINFMYTTVSGGVGDVKADYTEILAKATDANALVDEVVLLLAAGQLPPATVAAIRAAVASISLSKSDGPINRVGVAIMLTLASPDGLVLR